MTIERQRVTFRASSSRGDPRLQSRRLRPSSGQRLGPAGGPSLHSAKRHSITGWRLRVSPLPQFLEDRREEPSRAGVDRREVRSADGQYADSRQPSRWLCLGGDQRGKEGWGGEGGGRTHAPPPDGFDATPGSGGESTAGTAHREAAEGPLGPPYEAQRLGPKKRAARRASASSDSSGGHAPRSSTPCERLSPRCVRRSPRPR
jgi:hypothetical protein